MVSSEAREHMVDENYADLLVEYYGDTSMLERFSDSSVHIINAAIALLHVPVEQINQRTILEMGYSSMPLLYGVISEASLEASGIPRIRNIPNFNLKGQGVVIGIIDTGIDYTNPIFQYADGTTRIIEIWDQGIQSENFPANFGFGTIYNRDQINQALQSENPLDIVPSMDTNGHGTMVAGIAAGNEVPESDFYGIATEAEFVIVKLKPAKQYLRNFFYVPEGVDCFQNTDILFATQYMTEQSIVLNRPVVSGLALGSSQGSHDTYSILNKILSIQATRPGFGLVIAAGNEGNQRRHYFGTVNTTTRQDTVELNVGEDVAGFSMELWGQSPSLFSIDIQTPSGEYVPRIISGVDDHREITFLFEETVINVDYQVVEAQTGDQLILMRFANPAAGIWRFTVYESGDLNLGFHIWLPMGNFISEDTFFIRSDPYTTILSAGNSVGPITVTAYNDSDDSLYLNASRGYTRIGTIKPEFAAPGINVVGPDLNNGFVVFTGTSVAAAHTVGVAAMLMEWAVVRGNLPVMSTIEMKKLMMRGARRDIETVYPNRDWGYGILDVYNIFDSLRSGVII